MKKERRKNVPVTPPTLREMSETLMTYVPVDTIYRGMAESEDDGCALIFVHPDMIQPLRECTQLYVDGTFKVVLKKIERFIDISIHLHKNYF